MDESVENMTYENILAGKEIIEMKTNHIPKGLVPLERLFDNNDVYLKPKNKMDRDNTIDYNIGAVEDPQFVKISKSLSEENMEKYVQLIKQYSDICTWSYGDLKPMTRMLCSIKFPSSLMQKWYGKI